MQGLDVGGCSGGRTSDSRRCAGLEYKQDGVGLKKRFKYQQMICDKCQNAVSY